MVSFQSTSQLVPVIWQLLNGGWRITYASSEAFKASHLHQFELLLLQYQRAQSCSITGKNYPPTFTYMSLQKPTVSQMNMGESTPSLPPGQHGQFCSLGLPGHQIFLMIRKLFSVVPFHHTAVCCSASTHVLCENSGTPYSMHHNVSCFIKCAYVYRYWRELP